MNYDLVSILLIFFVFELLILSLIHIFNVYKRSYGKGRRVSGEILKDLGIGLLIGAAFQYKVTQLLYYVTALLGALFIILGVIMMEDHKI